jgi:copper chaperone CopZ
MLTMHADRVATLTFAADAARRMGLQANRFGVDTVRAAAIEEAVGKLTGVRAVHVYPRTASIVIRYSPVACDGAAILSAITDAEGTPVASVAARATG